jgi:hypothetical protein
MEAVSEVMFLPPVGRMMFCGYEEYYLLGYNAL